MGKYIVKDTDLLHNGQMYPEGSEVELTDKEAKALERILEKIEEKGGKSK